jgi:hypothetical protein
MISLPHCQNNWMLKRLGDLVAIDKGRVVQTQQFHSKDAVPYIGADGFRGNYSQFTTAPTAVLCEPTDVLMLWDGERSGLCTSGLSGAIGSTVARLRPKSTIRSRFVFKQFWSHNGWIKSPVVEPLWLDSSSTNRNWRSACSQGYSFGAYTSISRVGHRTIEHSGSIGYSE